MCNHPRNTIQKYLPDVGGDPLSMITGSRLMMPQAGPAEIVGQVGGGDQLAHLVLPPMATVVRDGRVDLVAPPDGVTHRAAHGRGTKGVIAKIAPVRTQESPNRRHSLPSPRWRRRFAPSPLGQPRRLLSGPRQARGRGVPASIGRFRECLRP
jgi:hypothetical protein